MELQGFSRDKQRELLTQLAAVYPNAVDGMDLGSGRDDPVALRNLAYLAEHGLVDAKLVGMDGGKIVVYATCTARGLDFLAEDGGLTAVLGVVTVRLEAETLKALLAAKVESSDLPAEEKSRVKALLQKAGEEGLKKAATLLVEQAMKHAPEAFRLLQSALS